MYQPETRTTYSIRTPDFSGAGLPLARVLNNLYAMPPGTPILVEQLTITTMVDRNPDGVPLFGTMMKGN